MRSNFIEWVHQGPELNDDIVHQAEQTIGMKLPTALIWFWSHVTNGGHPKPPPEIPIFGFEGHDLMDLHGVYGIGTARKFELTEAFNIPGMARLLPRLLPIGFDPGGGMLFVVCNEPNCGQVRYMVLDDIWDESQMPPGYFVAESMLEFARIIGY